MTREEAIAILDPKTTMVALLDYVYDPDTRIRIVEEACRMACAALRAQQESEKNDPLTLAELREMDGEPVWICDPGGSDGMWALVDLEYELCRTAQGGIAIFDTYGKTWLAYRREPEKGAI